ncbi:endolytic transglycosylase MltG [Granulicella aggregans]|uniref:endolytic transglycosylase MltG n=1 Tax=Granulicella aggregans TaxID=474949 RepID=UPI0021E02C54|nr:endolytic transglycosylase MltG [Granulicella aggregans]
MKSLATLLLLALLAAAAFAWLFYLPFGPSSETFVDIPTGTSGTAIGQQLAKTGIIRSPYAFDLMRAQKGGTLKAGEYRFDHPAPLAEVYARLIKGDVYTRTVAIPEGFNLFDIAAAVESAGLGTKASFLAAARQHTELIADLSPHATSLEGYLFPDTYHFSRHATPQQMLAIMVRRFRQVTTQLGLPKASNTIVILASLIEKEVSVDSERPLVASVFENRLAKSMPLQTDPTVIYAALLENRYRGTIYASDLKSDSPYNTYRHPGLPPGPICSPGVAALRAAISPAKSDFLYFVSDANGHSRFAATLKDHATNVTQYRAAKH